MFVGSERLTNPACQLHDAFALTLLPEDLHAIHNQLCTLRHGQASTTKLLRMQSVVIVGLVFAVLATLPAQRSCT